MYVKDINVKVLRERNIVDNDCFSSLHSQQALKSHLQVSNSHLKHTFPQVLSFYSLLSVFFFPVYCQFYLLTL